MKQTQELVYLGGTLNYNTELSTEIDQRLPEEHHRTVLYGRPRPTLELKIRMRKATLRRGHHSFLAYCTAWHGMAKT